MTKNIIFICFLVALFAACEPIEDSVGLQPLLSKTDLKFSVVQQTGYDNMVIVQASTPKTIPYWDLVLKISNKQIDTVRFPFAGTYMIKYSAFGSGGSVTDSTSVKVTKNDETLFSDPRWNFLTNGKNGKTWVIDMSDPLQFFGTQWPDLGADNWNWDPGAYQSWFPFKNTDDEGWIKFDLNGNYNYTASRKNLDGTYTAQKGAFSVEFKTDHPSMSLTGAKLAAIPEYYSIVNNWDKIYVISVTETELILGVMRDNSTTDGKCYLGYKYKPLAKK